MFLRLLAHNINSHDLNPLIGNYFSVLYSTWTYALYTHIYTADCTSTNGLRCLVWIEKTIKVNHDSLIPSVILVTKTHCLERHRVTRRVTRTWVSHRINEHNTLRPRQNGRHFADDTLKCIFLKGNVWIPIEISLKFVPKGSINNNPALFQISSELSELYEPMKVSSLTHICATRPQWVKKNIA